MCIYHPPSLPLFLYLSLSSSLFFSLSCSLSLSASISLSLSLSLSFSLSLSLFFYLSCSLSFCFTLCLSHHVSQTSKGSSGGGIFGGYFGGGNKKKSSVEMSFRPGVLSKPEGIEGWLLKKGSTAGIQLMGGDWQKRYDLRCPTQIRERKLNRAPKLFFSH